MNLSGRSTVSVENWLNMSHLISGSSYDTSDATVNWIRPATMPGAAPCDGQPGKEARGVQLSAPGSKAITDFERLGGQPPATTYAFTDKSFCNWSLPPRLKEEQHRSGWLYPLALESTPQQIRWYYTWAFMWIAIQIFLWGSLVSLESWNDSWDKW